MFITKKTKKEIQRRRSNIKRKQQSLLPKSGGASLTTVVLKNDMIDQSKNRTDITRSSVPEKKGYLMSSISTLNEECTETKPLSRKRSRSDEITVAGENIVPSTFNNVVIVPSKLSTQEAKKFRKQMRRQAQKDGKDPSKIEFKAENASILESKATHLTTADEGPVHKKVKTKKAIKFPSINDLVKQEIQRKQQQIQDQSQQDREKLIPTEVKKRYIAIDCEMVGIGPGGRQSVLARISAVDWEGKVLMDSYVRVPGKVTDFRTWVSGVTAKHLNSSSAMNPKECRAQVASLLKRKVLVGHALRNDLSALMLTHPPNDIRDTGKYPPYQHVGGDGKKRSRKLRTLAAQFLHKNIQQDGNCHDSVEDARTAMQLFKRAYHEWEATLLNKKR
jgi:RNA exonuclease 4